MHTQWIQFRYLHIKSLEDLFIAMGFILRSAQQGNWYWMFICLIFRFSLHRWLKWCSKHVFMHTPRVAGKFGRDGDTVTQSASLFIWINSNSASLIVSLKTCSMSCFFDVVLFLSPQLVSLVYHCIYLLIQIFTIDALSLQCMKFYHIFVVVVVVLWLRCALYNVSIFRAVFLDCTLAFWMKNAISLCYMRLTLEKSYCA